MGGILVLMRKQPGIKAGAASADIEELLQVHLKDDVKVVVQTGGSMEWKRKDVGADKLCRFVYNKKAGKSGRTGCGQYGNAGNLYRFP